MTNAVIKEFFLKDESAMLQFGEKLQPFCQPGAIIFLQGPLGAGKTTLVRGLLQSMHCAERIKSPTFTLVESYMIGTLPIFHFDLYRLKSPRELLDIGLEDYLIPEAVCLFEWPEKAVQILPKPTVYCTIEIPENGQGRRIILRENS